MKSYAFRQKLQELHIALLNKEKSKALATDFFNSPIIRQYADRFASELPNRGDVLSYREFCNRISAAEVVLFGDFHTHRQSQRQFLRCLRQSAKTSARRRLAIALEAFTTDDQASIDAYMCGKISERTFLERTRYFTKWRFHWPHFKMILEFAKEHSLLVYGIELPSRVGGDRDAHFASQLARIASDKNVRRVFALIGEHHLTKDKIPMHLHSLMHRRPTLRVYQNVDHCYQYSETAHTSTSPTYLNLGGARLCVLNSPAWHKWKTASEWDDFDEIEVGEFPRKQFAGDLDYEFMLSAKTLLEFFNLPISEEVLDYYSLTPLQHKGRTRSPATQLMLDAGGVAISNSSRKVLMSKLNFNYIAQAAGQFVFTSGERASKSQGGVAGAFLQMAAGAFSSLLMNPKRKITRLGTAECHLRTIIPQSQTSIGEFLSALKSASLSDDEPVMLQVAATMGSAVGSLLFSMSLSQEHCADVSRQLFTPHADRLNDNAIIAQIAEAVGF